jgi:hypothetical protein
MGQDKAPSSQSKPQLNISNKYQFDMSLAAPIVARGEWLMAGGRSQRQQQSSEEREQRYGICV